MLNPKAILIAGWILVVLGVELLNAVNRDWKRRGADIGVALIYPGVRIGKRHVA